MDDRSAVRRVGLGTALIGAAGFVLLAWLRVPWETGPGGGASTIDPATVFSADQVAHAEHFSAWARTWSWSALAVSVALACWLGFGRRGRAIAAAVPGWWWVRIVLVVAILTLVGRVVTLPLSIAHRQLRLDEGLAAGGWSAWAIDVVKGDLVSVLSTSVALVVLVGCARRWRRLWPAVAGAVAAGLVILGSFVYPLVVEPVFNNFESLSDGPLRTEILALAQTEGVAVDDVLVADASRRTTTLNAYVSGLGSTRRVVLYDNLVNDTPVGETLSVVAHELAHAKHDDVLTGTLLGAAGVLFGVGLLGVLLPGRRRGGDPVESAARPGARLEVAAVPLVLALVAVAGLLAAPVQNGISRQIEARADRVALQVTGDPEALIALQKRLAIRSLADPTPPAWSQWWFGSHPTVLQRIAVARVELTSATE